MQRLRFLFSVFNLCKQSIPDAKGSIYFSPMPFMVFLHFFDGLSPSALLTPSECVFLFFSVGLKCYWMYMQAIGVIHAW
jgi:hypothetical protein